MKVLITGGKGLIGQAIAKSHLNSGDFVYLWDNESNIFNDYSDYVGVNLQDISLKESIENIKPDIISHQASFVSVGESQYNVKKYMDNNIGVTSELIQSLIDTGFKPKLLLHAGSMGPYGEGIRFCSVHKEFYVKNIRKTLDILCQFCGSETTYIKSKETQELIPVSQYGISKLAQENMWRVFSETYEVPVISLRYFSVYGNTCNPTNPFTGVLSIVANKIINSKDIDLNEDGLQTRDLINCNEIGKFHTYISHNLETDIMFDIVNLGTGNSVSIQYVVDRMLALSKSVKNIRFNGNIRKGDIKDSCADMHKMRDKYNFIVDITLDKDLEIYCQYILKNINAYQVEDTCKLEHENLIRKGLII